MPHSTSHTGGLGGTRASPRAAGPDQNDELNDEASGSRRRRRHARRQRAGALAAALAAAGLLAAACGGSAAGPAAHLTAYQRELAYAQCMRANGLPSFPDPQSDGTFQSTLANRGDFSGPRFLSANKACTHLEGPGVTPAQFQQNVRQVLRYAACMRAHGIADFQASVQGSRVGMGVQGPGSEMNTPQFLAAQQACRKLFPGGS